MSTRMADEVVYLLDTDNEEAPPEATPKRPRVAPDEAMIYESPQYHTSPEIPDDEDTGFMVNSTTWLPENGSVAGDQPRLSLVAGDSDSVVVIDLDNDSQLPRDQPQPEDEDYVDDVEPTEIRHLVVLEAEDSSDDDIIEIDSAEIDPLRFKPILWAPQLDDDDDEPQPALELQPHSERHAQQPPQAVVPIQPQPTPEQVQIQREVMNRIQGYEHNRLMLIQGVNQWQHALDSLRTYQYRIGERLRHLIDAARQGATDVMEEIQQLQGQVHQANNEIMQKQSLVESSRKRLYEVDNIIHNLRTSQRLPFAYAATPAVALHHRPVVNSNVYDGGLGLKDDVDLQTLLDNIRSDEDLEEGLEATPEEMNVLLLKHQRKGLTWMLRMEKARNQGGILADDMGLGKTIQAIALITRNKPDAKENVKTTLIVAPVSLLRQWAEEIKQKVKAEHLIRVGIYHGVTRKTLLLFARLKRYDVILTLYSTLQNEFKRHYAAEIKKSVAEGQLSTFLPTRSDNLNERREYELPFFGSGKTFYRIILDEAQYIKNKNTIQLRAVALLKGRYRFCLLGTPMQNSIDELFPILRFLNIRPYCFEDKFRIDIALPLKSKGRQYDDYDRELLMKRLRALLAAILLRRTKTLTIDGKPILELPAKHLNRLDVKLEEEEREYYKRVESKIQSSARKLLGKAPVEGLNGILALLTRLRQACLHLYLIEIGEYRRLQLEEASRFIKQWGSNFDKLFDTTHQMDLLAVTVVANKLTAPKKEPSADDQNGNMLDTNGFKPELNGMLWDDNGMMPGSFESSSNQNGMIKSEITSDETELADVQCPNCNNWYTPGQDNLIVHRKCGHIFCLDCVQLLFEDSGESSYKCPTCVDGGTSGKVADVTARDCIDFRVFDLVWNQLMLKEQFVVNCKLWWLKLKRVPIDTIIDTVIADHEGAFPTLAKMVQCINKVKEIFETHPGEKIIIFSQFTTFFDLMGRKLDDNEIKYLRYDGTMSVDTKNDTIKRFYQDDEYKVLFLSLKAGNVGLTLTCASHIIMMDPFWNPYVEDQAMDRAHRIGQTREVHVHRLFVSGTVELRILELQDHKRELIGAAMSETGLQTVARASKREIGFLFGLNNLKE